MNELGRLQAALRHFELTEQSFHHAREEMRAAIRAYLCVKTEGSKHGTIAKKLGVSTQQLSNVKLGYSIPSSGFAMRLMKVCGDKTKEEIRK